MNTKLVVKESKSGKTQSLWLRAFGKDTKVIGMWESFSGWYWFATEKLENGLYFGFVQGIEQEWGYFSEKELRSSSMIWKVPKTNWVYSGKGDRITEHL